MSRIRKQTFKQLLYAGADTLIYKQSCKVTHTLTVFFGAVDIKAAAVTMLTFLLHKRLDTR